MHYERMVMGYVLSVFLATSVVGQELQNNEANTSQVQSAEHKKTASRRTTLFKCKNGDTTVFSDQPCQTAAVKQETVTIIQNDAVDNSDLRQKVSDEQQRKEAMIDNDADNDQKVSRVVLAEDKATAERNARLDEKNQPRKNRSAQESRHDNPPIQTTGANKIPTQLVNCNEAGCDGTNGVHYVDIGGGNFLNTQTGQVQRPTGQ